MKHVVIAAHPAPNSFTMAMADAYISVARDEGHETVFRDLYRMKFDPVLPLHELPWSDDFHHDPVIEAEHRLLADADIFTFIYPFWFNAPPAIIKGYMERVFCAGFAYKPTSHGNEPLLTGRSMFSITSSGAPTEWLIKTKGLEFSRMVFDEHFSAVCGLNLIAHKHFGRIVPGTRPDVVDRHADEVRECFMRQFGEAAVSRRPSKQTH